MRGRGAVDLSDVIVVGVVVVDADHRDVGSCRARRPVAGDVGLLRLPPRQRCRFPCRPPARQPSRQPGRLPAVVWIIPWSSLRGLEFCRGTHLQSEPRRAQVVNTDGSFEIMEASGHPHSGGPPSSTARVSVGLVCPKRCDQQCLRSIQHQGSSEILCRRCESVRNLSFTAVAESFFDRTRPSVIRDIISSSRNAPPN